MADLPIREHRRLRATNRDCADWAAVAKHRDSNYATVPGGSDGAQHLMLGVLREDLERR